MLGFFLVMFLAQSATAAIFFSLDIISRDFFFWLYLSHSKVESSVTVLRAEVIHKLKFHFLSPTPHSGKVFFSVRSSLLIGLPGFSL